MIIEHLKLILFKMLFPAQIQKHLHVYNMTLEKYFNLVLLQFG